MTCTDCDCENYGETAESELAIFFNHALFVCPICQAELADGDQLEANQ